MCNWVLLPDKQNSTERRCPEEGEPYYEDHDAELHWHTWREREAHEKSERQRQMEQKWRKAKRLIAFPGKKNINTGS